MCTCELIQRLKNKVNSHQQLSLDPKAKVARWLEQKSGSEIKNAIHVAACGTFHGEKWFEKNR